MGGAVMWQGVAVVAAIVLFIAILFYMYNKNTRNMRRIEVKKDSAKVEKSITETKKAVEEAESVASVESVTDPIIPLNEPVTLETIPMETISVVEPVKVEKKKSLYAPYENSAIYKTDIKKDVVANTRAVNDADFSEDYDIGIDGQSSSHSSNLSNEFKNLSPKMKTFIVANILNDNDENK